MEQKHWGALHPSLEGKLSVKVMEEDNLQLVSSWVLMSS